MIQNTDWAYLAGIIDGEGCVGIEVLHADGKSRLRDYYSSRLCIINTNLEMLQWVQRNFGGTIQTKLTKATNKLCYRWHIFGRNLVATLQGVLPYLIIKRKQAETVLEYRSKIVPENNARVSPEEDERRRLLYLECRRLNQIGAPSPLSPSQD
jgi:hypothetical protein